MKKLKTTVKDSSVSSNHDESKIQVKVLDDAVEGKYLLRVEPDMVSLDYISNNHGDEDIYSWAANSTTEYAANGGKVQRHPQEAELKAEGAKWMKEQMLSEYNDWKDSLIAKAEKEIEILRDRGGALSEAVRVLRDVKTDGKKPIGVMAGEFIVWPDIERSHDAWVDDTEQMLFHPFDKRNK
jgi:hypothetical protein